MLHHMVSQFAFGEEVHFASSAFVMALHQVILLGMQQPSLLVRERSIARLTLNQRANNSVDFGEMFNFMTVFFKTFLAITTLVGFVQTVVDFPLVQLLLSQGVENFRALLASEYPCFMTLVVA